MQQFKRVAAMLLCLVMLFSCLPMGIFAAETAGTVVDAAVIFSDLHTSSSDDKQSTVTGIMTALKNTGLPFSSVTSAGDAFSVNADNDYPNGKYTGYTSTITGYIQSVLGNVPVNYVWSDHDRYAVQADGTTLLDKTSRLVYGAGSDGIYGNDDDDNYYVYALSMADLCSYDRYSAGFNYTQSSNNRASKGFTATVAEAIENFKADAAKLNKDRPLFITSHQPLFDNRNDNAFAEDWFDAINEVAMGMDVAFFYGHNHKYDTGSDYYYAKGSKMNVATADNWNWDYDVGEGYLPSMDLTSEQKTLNFTHMCAGYMAPSSTNSTSPTTREGVAMAVTIYEDAINYTTYDANGVYTGNYALNETVTRAFAAESGETVPEETVPDETEPEATEPGIDEELSNSVTIGGSQTYEDKTVYVLVDAPENGQKYLISNDDLSDTDLTTDWEPGDNVTEKGVVPVRNSSNGIDHEFIDVLSGDITASDGTVYSDGYIELDNANAVWTATTSGSGWTFANNNRYLNSSSTVSTSSSRTVWTYNASTNRLTSGSKYYFYFSYNNSGMSSWEWKTTDKSSGSSTRDIFFYKQVTAKVPVGAASVTYTMQASNLKHNLVGDNKTAQLDYALLADGEEAAALPTGGKYTFGIVGDNHDIIESIAADGTVTFTGETGSCRVKVAYTWTDGDQTYTVYKYVTVSVVTPSNYPEYPDEGSVKVGKTGTGIDFQSSGIAQVEISASGVPIKKGADVIIMLDTSSSMTSHTVTGSSKTRAQVLEESLANLIAYFKTPGADGTLMDVKVAIADFNGYFGDGVNVNGNMAYAESGTPYDRASGDYVKNGTDNGSGYDQPSHAIVYTNNGNSTTPRTGKLDASAFVPVQNLADSYKLHYTSGTNYDYAFDAIYQLGTSIKEANGNEERDLYVIFMSDGAALQWNYFGTENRYTKWNQWITGGWSASDLTTTNLNSTAHAYYYDLNDHDGDGQINEHRMANAIKGDPDTQYEIIRKTNAGLPEGTLTAVAGKSNLYTVPGLGATMFTINFDARDDGSILEENIDKALASTASNQVGTTKTYYKVTSADELQHAFDSIGSEIAYAAYNARYVDQMGDDYNLQMATSTYSVVDGTSTTNKTIEPKIEIISYDIYTRQDYLNGTITEDKIGDRKGTYTILETVTFNADGTEAYSDKKSGNILIDGVICAQTFWYNTTPTAKAIEGVSIPTGTNADGTTTGSANVLPSETFYWKMGTVQTSELAMRYDVYLEGSMEGTREGGSYPTNEYATLYYDNYLGNPCKKDTVSPVMAWKEANVSYAFYLVDENGNIVVNQTTGQTGSFANKIAVTNPVVYETVLLNSDEEVSSIDIASLGVLPEGYTLYDYDGDKTGATYTVTINSNTTGSWKITSVKDVATTYVTQYDPSDASAYSNALSNSTVGDDYTHTIVWFAVVWKVQALPDTVVVDYGLPVDISVLRNDMFGDNGKLAGVGAYSDTLNLDGHDTANALAATTYTGKYGTAVATASTGKVRYTLNTMQMNGYEKFAYAVNYTGNENAGYYYDTVTVIPATTIYYEDDFLTYSVKNNNGTPADTTDDTVKATDWAFEGTLVDGAVQDEDRPGQYSLTDANNIYGYDSVNLNMSTFSLGRARKVHVDANTYATAEFTFYGTGFDVIGMTSNTTGTLTVQVKNAAGTAVKNAAVHTYYGCNYEQLKDADGNTKVDENGNAVYGWVSYPDENKAMYQVPVMQIEELPYGQYTVTIKATYANAFDKTTEPGYWLYLDAIRIYDPANDGAVDNDTVIEDAYKADGEGWPSYIELRNKIIAASSFDNVANDALATDMEGLVFIDGDPKVGDAQIADYISYGPNNEVYLAPGQRVAFLLNTPNNIKNIHIGIKSADGNVGTYTITNIAKQDIVDGTTTKAKAGDYYNAKTNTISTTTDMYYDLTGWKGDIIVISNTGDKYDTTGVISLTNIKSTYTSAPANGGAETASEVQTYAVMAAAEDEVTTESTETYVYMTPAAAKLTLRSLNSAAEEEVPEETEPETTVPEETEPEATVPEETEPETTVPEETEPEVTEPEQDSGSSGGFWGWVGKLIGWIFG